MGDEGIGYGALIYVVAAVFIGVAVWARFRRGVRLGFGVRRGAGRELGLGLAITAVAMLLVFGVESALGLVTTTPHAVPWLGLLLALVFVVLAAAVEEIVFRAGLLGGLWVVTRPWVAVTISAVLFGLAHAANPGATVLSVGSNALGGVMYGLAFVLTHRIWMSLGMHVAWNFVQGPILGFPVSGTSFNNAYLIAQAPQAGPEWLTGGIYGPEGGVVGIAARLVVIGLVLLAARRLLPAPVPRVEPSHAPAATPA